MIYKTIRVAVKGSTCFDQYARNGHGFEHYSTWKVKIGYYTTNGRISKGDYKIVNVELLETYATPTKRQLENAEKLFNNGF